MTLHFPFPLSLIAVSMAADTPSPLEVNVIAGRPLGVMDPKIEETKALKSLGVKLLDVKLELIVERSKSFFFKAYGDRLKKRG
jgi:hypothetical protein